MTKYILVGGHPHKAADGGSAFAKELVTGFDEPVKILDCLFARPRDNWDQSHNEDRELFQKNLSNKILEIALADPDKFVEQVNWGDAIYLRGGIEATLINILQRDTRWQQLLDGKTLAGSSAGAIAIAKYYYDLDDLKLGEGLGLVPVKVLVHYQSDYNAPNIDWDRAYSDLKSYKEDLPLLTLKEGQFEVINA